MTSNIFIPWARPDYWGNEKSYVLAALASTWISGGEFVDRLEKDFANFNDVPYALSASNGTTALHMAYLALNLQPGDEVVVPGFAFLAAANLALHMKVKPVFAEVDPATWCLRAADVEKCLSRRTRAIVPVHTYGNVCDMDEIIALANSHHIPVVEDSAEAFASRYKHRMAGSMGLLGSFSFQATKTITTGEGGMVVTRNQGLLARMALYRNHGMLRKRHYWHELAGHNFRLTNLQAAIGCAQLERIDEIIRERQRVHAQYQMILKDTPGVTLQRFLPEVQPVLWAMAVKLDPLAYPQGRDVVLEQMKQVQIESRPGFVSPSFMKHLYACPELPVCEDLSRQVISLPSYPTIRDDQVQRICAELMRLRK